MMRPKMQNGSNKRQNRLSHRQDTALPETQAQKLDQAVQGTRRKVMTGNILIILTN